MRCRHGPRRAPIERNQDQAGSGERGAGSERDETRASGIGRGVYPSKRLAAWSKAEPPKTILFSAQRCLAAQIAFHWMLHYTPPMFRDLPIRARELKATPAVLERIYEGARLGLKGESLALAAGLLPEEFARLKLMDRTAEIAEMKGRADSEMSMSRVVFEAAEGGDAKAALEFLRHRHEWVAKQQVQVDVAQSISITAALEMAEKRVRAAEAIEDAVEIRRPLARPQALAEMGPV